MSIDMVGRGLQLLLGAENVSKCRLVPRRQADIYASAAFRDCRSQCGPPKSGFSSPLSHWRKNQQ
jgi:hypothetical protein